MGTTQRIPTHIISHPDFKQRHSSVFTYNEYIALVVDHEFWEIEWYIETKWEFIKPKISTRLFPRRIV